LGWFFEHGSDGAAIADIVEAGIHRGTDVAASL
jgi:hypothetical protein